MTAKRRDAIAAPEMKKRAIMRNRDAVFVIVDGARPDGREYASGMISQRFARLFLDNVGASSAMGVVTGYILGSDVSPNPVRVSAAWDIFRSMIRARVTCNWKLSGLSTSQ